MPRSYRYKIYAGRMLGTIYQVFRGFNCGYQYLKSCGASIKLGFLSLIITLSYYLFYVCSQMVRIGIMTMLLAAAVTVCKILTKRAIASEKQQRDKNRQKYVSYVKGFLAAGIFVFGMAYWLLFKRFQGLVEDQVIDEPKVPFYGWSLVIVAFVSGIYVLSTEKEVSSELGSQLSSPSKTKRKKRNALIIRQNRQLLGGSKTEQSKS